MIDVEKKFSTWFFLCVYHMSELKRLLEHSTLADDSQFLGKGIFASPETNKRVRTPTLHFMDEAVVVRGPRIQVGPKFQAVLPAFGKESHERKDIRVVIPDDYKSQSTSTKKHSSQTHKHSVHAKGATW